jgi:HEAT repeat protein
LTATESQAALSGVRALAGIGAPAAERLVAALSHTNGDVAAAAAQALEQIGPEAVPALVDGIQARPGKPGAAAGRVLLKIGPASIPPLVSALAAAQNPNVKSILIAVLGCFGPAAHRSVPLLKAAAGDPVLIRTADRALRRILPPKTPQK